MKEDLSMIRYVFSTIYRVARVESILFLGCILFLPVTLFVPVHPLVAFLIFISLLILAVVFIVCAWQKGKKAIIEEERRRITTLCESIERIREKQPW